MLGVPEGSKIEPLGYLKWKGLMVEGLKGTDSVQSDDNSQGRVNLD